MDRTQQMGPLSDPQRTQAMQMPIIDPQRTQAMPNILGAPAQPSLSMEVVLGRKYALAQSISRSSANTHPNTLTNCVAKLSNYLHAYWRAVLGWPSPIDGASAPAKASVAHRSL